MAQPAATGAQRLARTHALAQTGRGRLKIWGPARHDEKVVSGAAILTPRNDKGQPWLPSAVESPTYEFGSP